MPPVVSLVRDGRLFYAMAAALLALTLAGLRVDGTLSVHDTLFVVDVSESMNVDDADPAQPSLSRLALARAGVREAMSALGCGSRVALGVFAGDDVVVLFEPLEVCDHYAAMVRVVDGLSSRARWIGDSRVETALRAGLREAQSRKLNLVFITDGDEMPHRSAPRLTDLERLRNKVRGAVISVGAEVPLPVPHLDEQGEVIGYWSVQEAAKQGFYPQHTATITALEAGSGSGSTNFDDVTEHVSAARPAYLRALAVAAGLDALEMHRPGDAAAAAVAPAISRTHAVSMDAAWLWNLLAAAAALAGWLAPVAFERVRPTGSGVTPNRSQAPLS